MNAAEKRRLSEEANLQIAALKRINRWKITSFVISAAGVAFTYAGFWGTPRNLFCGIGGIAAIVAGSVCVIVLNLGLKNGRRNVEKMLDVLERV